MSGFLDGAIRSFFSRRYYYNLAHKYRGIGFGLVTMLTFIGILLTGPWLIYAPVTHMIEEIPNIVNTLPAITFKDDKLSIDKPVPYYQKFGSEHNNFGVLIDTNYKIADIVALTQYMKENNVLLLLTDSKIVIAHGGKLESKNIIDLKSINSTFSITHSDWDKLVSTYIKWGALAFLGVILITLFVGIFIGSFLCGFLTAIVVKILTVLVSSDVKFSGAMRLSFAALIPVVIFSCVPGLLNIAGPVGEILSLGALSGIIWILYVSFAVYSSKFGRSSYI